MSLDRHPLVDVSIGSSAVVPWSRSTFVFHRDPDVNAPRLRHGGLIVAEVRFWDIADVVWPTLMTCFRWTLVARKSSLD